MSIDCDVAIVGGGMVGASLALALVPLGLNVAVVEAVLPETDGQPSFDERTIALSNGTRRIFQGLGVWDEMQRGGTPIRRIHVSDRGRFGAARLSAEEQGVPALGYVVETRAVGAALWRRLRASGTTRLVAPVRVTGSKFKGDHVALTLAASGGEGATAGDPVPPTLTARLVVAADGAGSIVRRAAGVDADRWDYGQTAIITNVVTERFHEYTAYERFTPTGPLALLPIGDGRCVVVWTLEPEVAKEVLAYDDARFLAELQERFGWRLGRLTKVGKRLSYPLALTQAEALDAPRIVMIGNAAQGLHPIAGQGFNLGLRDAATLAEVLADWMEEEGGADSGAGTRVADPDAGSRVADPGAGSTVADPGDPTVLDRYADWRRTDRRALIAFTDGLVRLFASPFAPVRAARSLGLMLFDVSPTAKTAMAKLSLGFAGKLPRLARGLPLRAADAAGGGGAMAAARSGPGGTTVTGAGR
jgi:2-octaprenyl-6-methoxyphenol hydroxylase